jgi:hypothetical protein
MKKLFKSISVKRVITFFALFAYFAIFASVNVWANRPIGIVSDIHGNVFLSKDKQTKMLKVGDHITDLSEIRTEVGAQISFSDYHDHRYHLSGQGQIKIMNKTIELYQGYLWAQSSHPEAQAIIQTVNSSIDYGKGELIISFDSYTKKSQVLVLNGTAQFSNIFDANKSMKLTEGQFSYIQKNKNYGLPRNAARVGFSSFKKITTLFRGIKPLSKLSIMKEREREIEGKSQILSLKEDKASFGKHRSIASVMAQKSQMSESSPPAKGSGKIKFRSSKDRLPDTQLESKLMNFHKGKVNKIKQAQSNRKKKFRRDYSKSSNVVVRVFGKRGQTRKTARTPASHGPSKSMKPRSYSRPSIKKIQINQEFEGSVVDEYKKQMRHSEEVNGLIDELRSYDQDFKKAY